ncbi:MAG: protease complex subunit PrcB family protein [Bacillota bacterium]
MAEPGLRVLLDESELTEAYEVGAAELGVDFATELVCAIQRGIKPTGGYSLSVKAVTRDQNVIFIHVAVRDPGPYDLVTMTMTAPMAVIAMPRREAYGSRGSVCFAVVGRSGEVLFSRRVPLV